MAEKIEYPVLSDPAMPLLDTEVERDIVVPSHTREIFDPTMFASVVQWVIGEVQHGRYDAIAGSGHSGLPLMGAVSYRTGIPFIAVRKYDERPKGSSAHINGVLPHRPLKYAIVDDFVASGETVERIFSQMQRTFPQASLAGGIFYGLRADIPGESYSFVETTRSDIARVIGQGIADAIRIHARPRSDRGGV